MPRLNLTHARQRRRPQCNHYGVPIVLRYCCYARESMDTSAQSGNAANYPLSKVVIAQQCNTIAMDCQATVVQLPHTQGAKKREYVDCGVPLIHPDHANASPQTSFHFDVISSEFPSFEHQGDNGVVRQFINELGFKRS